MNRLTRIAVALALVLVATAAGACGGKETRVDEAIESRNETLREQGVPVELDCPDKVDGHEGTEFDCTLKAEQGDGEKKIKMEIQKDGENLIVVEKDQAGFERAVEELAIAQQPQQPQGGQQPGGQQPGGQQPQPDQGGGGGGGQGE